LRRALTLQYNRWTAYGNRTTTLSEARMRSALIFTLALLSQPLRADEQTPPDRYERVLKANGIEPTPAGILGFVSPLSDKRLRQLVRQLGDNSYARREQAMKLLSVLPVVPSQALHDAAQSRDPEVRYRARIVLNRTRKARNSPALLAAFKKMRGKAFAKGAPVVLEMIPQLESETMIAAAAEALDSIAQPEHVGKLRTALRRGKHTRMRLAALRVLVRLAGEKAVDDLKDVVKEDDEQIRMAAAAALVNLKRRESLEVLVKLLDSKDVAIRAGAVRYLRNITGRRFGYLAIDKSPARQRAARQWLAWVSRHGATAKLNLDPKQAVAASPRLTLAAELLRQISGHGSTVYGVAFSPDGKRLASGSGDGLVKIWEVADGRLVWEKSGHGGITVYSVAFSPDGKLLASGSYDKTVKLWDAKSGKELRTLRGHAQGVRIVAFSADGQWLASCGDDGDVIVWEVETGKAVHILKGHTATVRTVTFSPDGLLVASAGSDETIRIWDRKTGKPKQTLRGHNASVRSVAFSPDGGTLASCGLDNTVRLWDVASGAERVTLGRHSLSVKSVAYAPDGRFVASAGNDRVVKIWDADSGRLITTLTGPTGQVTHIAISKDGKLLAACGADRAIFIWKLSSTGIPTDTSPRPAKAPDPKPGSPRPAPRPSRK
jgi:WD40 repeat protein